MMSVDAIARSAAESSDPLNAAHVRRPDAP